MRLLWTKSKTILGPIITWGLNEPCSHFAIEFHGDIVLHSNFLGVSVMHRADFLNSSEVVFSKPIALSFEDEAKLLSQIMRNYFGKKYDWKWFFSLVKAAACCKLFNKPMPDSVKSKSRDRFLCTECVEFLQPVIGVVDIGNGSPYLLAKQMGVL
jgi:hypothetical protein